MIAVIFEAWPAPGMKQRYLDIAASLKEELSRIEGFLSIERFESLSEDGKLLSLSFFEDEAAISRWRALERHRAAQSQGRSGVFSNYRLRIGHVVRDYGLFDRDEAPDDSRAFHEPVGICRK